MSWCTQSYPNTKVSLHAGYIYRTHHQYGSWYYMTPCCGLDVQNHIRYLSELKAWTIHWAKPQVGKNFALVNFTGNIYRTLPQYGSWYLTPCCLLELQNRNQALKWVNPLVGISFVDWSFTSDIYGAHPQYRCWHLKLWCGFHAHDQPQAQIKVRAMP
jgi:hypothetical protein